MLLEIIQKILSFFGRWLINSTRSFIALIQFTLCVFRRGFLYNKQFPGSHIVKHSINTQVIFSGIDALFPSLFILSILVSVSITAQLILFYQTFYTEIEIISLLTHIVALQLSPILTSIVLIARSGSAITVDIGSMSINHEIKGLESLGIDPYIYLAYPRFIALAVSQMALAIYFSIATMVFGVLFASLLDSPSNFKYFFILLNSLTLTELALFLINNAICGVAIATYACFFGLNIKRSVTEVPQATQQAIVKSLMAIFFINAFFAFILK
ncbi:MAG: ABC transporter permease [Methylococcales bacterium]|nr:ABC transporter permease [Methylococcales bacterium]